MMTMRFPLANEASIGSKLPYLAHLDPQTLLLKNNMLMQILKLDGLNFETSDLEDLIYRQTMRSEIFRSINDRNISLHYTIIREKIEHSDQFEFPDHFSKSVNDRWNNRISAKALYKNQIYISILRTFEGAENSRLNFLFDGARGAESRRKVTIAENLVALNAVREALLSAFALYNAKTLATYEDEGETFSEPLAFLSALLNGQVIPRLLPEGMLSDHLGTRRISFGHQTVELGHFGHRTKSFVGIVSVKNYPNSSYPGMFDQLLRLPCEFVVTHSFSFIGQAAAASKMKLVMRRMRAADDQAQSLRHELLTATDDVAAGRAVYGDHHFTIAVCGPEEATVDSGVADIQAVLADAGIVAVREDLGLEPAFWAQMPGNRQFIARRATISAANFASFASCHSFATGTKTSNHWGPYVALLETTAAGPYYFNFHQGDLGNFTIIGPSGGGKTVILNFLLAQAQKFRPKLILFDKDRGSEIFVRALGGRYEFLRPERPSGLNPLVLPETPAHRAFLMEWLGTLLSSRGQPLRPPDLALIEAAVQANFKAPPHLQNLTAFSDLLRGGTRPSEDDLYARLRPWFGTGEYAWLFDNPSDHLTLDDRVLGFDMTRLLDDPVTRTPAMLYLFHRIEEALDGEPAIIVVDEGWKALDDPVFVRRIRDWEKTIRKQNGIVGFVTQSVEDTTNSQISSAIIEQAATHIFLPNPKARYEDYVLGFSLTKHEFEIVRGLPDHSRCFLIKRGRESVVVRLDLNLEPDLLAVLSGREQSVRLLDEIRNRRGDLPEHWMDEFLERSR